LWLLLLLLRRRRLGRRGGRFESEIWLSERCFFHEVCYDGSAKEERVSLKFCIHQDLDADADEKQVLSIWMSMINSFPFSPQNILPSWPSITGYRWHYTIFAACTPRSILGSLSKVISLAGLATFAAAILLLHHVTSAFFFPYIYLHLLLTDEGSGVWEFGAGNAFTRIWREVSRNT
jgi:hypothetical protein